MNTEVEKMITVQKMPSKFHDPLIFLATGRDTSFLGSLQSLEPDHGELWVTNVSV